MPLMLYLISRPAGTSHELLFLAVVCKEAGNTDFSHSCDKFGTIDLFRRVPTKSASPAVLNKDSTKFGAIDWIWR